MFKCQGCNGGSEPISIRLDYVAFLRFVSKGSGGSNISATLPFTLDFIIKSQPCISENLALNTEYFKKQWKMSKNVMSINCVT